MTTEWRWFKSSKYDARCDYCHKPIDQNEGRWTNKQDNARYNACSKCMVPPDDKPRTPPPLKNAESIQPTIDGAVVPTLSPSPSSSDASVTQQNTTLDARDARIQRSHDENMESAQCTRNAIATLTSAILKLANAVTETKK